MIVIAATTLLFVLRLATLSGMGNSRRLAGRAAGGAGVVRRAHRRQRAGGTTAPRFIETVRLGS
ncbi:hypothetical protein [Aromatoleum diolicum]|uniref:Uncharacterized protein n=1 Tax=Aromatoleum diolicum TaxID=75796 RepID=A0ABX1QH15_9RHOO|nr:hypothetical protein [Aromatoleum diolicum]NMG76782.1 hypothetical protein [Aromatoleum diolicum]